MVIEAGCIDEHMHGMYHTRLCSLLFPPELHAGRAFLRLAGVCFSILFVPVLKVQEKNRKHSFSSPSGYRKLFF